MQSTCSHCDPFWGEFPPRQLQIRLKLNLMETPYSRLWSLGLPGAVGSVARSPERARLLTSVAAWATSIATDNGNNAWDEIDAQRATIR